MSKPVVLANRCNSNFHNRVRLPLLPPPSAVISSFLARTPLLAVILNISNQFLLFGIHRDDRVAFFVKPLDGLIDVAELRVPIRMSLALLVLSISLKTVIQLFE